MRASRVAVVAVAAGVVLGMAAGAQARKAKRPPKPVEYCEENELPTDGEVEDPPIFPLERQGLRFWPMHLPDYQEEWADSDLVPMLITVENTSDEPADAVVEVNVCAPEEECLSFGVDFWQVTPHMKLLPGEVRSTIAFTPDPVSLGVHRVTFTLLDGEGNGADFHFGPYLRVGKPEVRLDGVTADGQPVAERGKNEIRMTDPEKGIELSATVSNLGFAPTALYAVFAVYVNRTCMDEVYAPSRLTEATRTEDFVVEPRRVEGGDERIEIKGLWARSNVVGDHTVSMRLYDMTGEQVAERLGMRLVVR